MCWVLLHQPCLSEKSKISELVEVRLKWEKKSPFLKNSYQIFEEKLYAVKRTL